MDSTRSQEFDNLVINYYIWKCQLLFEQIQNGIMLKKTVKVKSTLYLVNHPVYISVFHRIILWRAAV